MRRDAVRNQQSVLEAARTVLAEYGTEATMELIASRAGVGVGTVYRNFPNKDALIDALVRAIFEQLETVALKALERGDGTGLEELLIELGQSFADHRGYAKMLVGQTKSDCGARMKDLIAALAEQARAAGQLASWVDLGDVMTTVWAIRGVVDTAGSVVPLAWRRQLDIQLAALRLETVPSERPGVTRAQLDAIATREELSAPARFPPAVGRLRRPAP